MSLNVVSVAQTKLDICASKIAAAHKRVVENSDQWVDATLELAAALLAAKRNMGANVTFHEWLKERKLDFYGKNDRAALISFAENDEIAREILKSTKSRSYETIWREHRDRFPKNRNTTASSSSAKKKRNAPPRGRADLHRRAKLGDELMDKLKGTTLDRADELDELVRLNRGAPEGEHTEIVKQLAADAIAGKTVSAIAEIATHGTSQRRTRTLLQAWRKRMAAAWLLAPRAEKEEFIRHLMSHLDEGTQ